MKKRLNFILFSKDIDDCSPNPCQNGGTCTDKLNNYKCSCAAGYTGYNCSTSAAEKDNGNFATDSN